MEPTTYQSAGVDIDQANRALRAVTSEIHATHSDAVVGGIGGFGGLFRAQFPDMEQPVLVSSIDGVGTKTKVAAMLGKYDGIGHDIVNHCVNDILCQGARPLFFLDYFASERLEPPVFEAVLRGIAEACLATGTSLIGGETAEMPGVYLDGEIDIVGTIVGVVDYEKRLPRQKTRVGDVVIGIASSGLHSNGYTLARRALFELGGLSVTDHPDGMELPIGEALLVPHKCYFNSVYPLVQNDAIHCLAHITGGGFYDNIPRILPSDAQAKIDKRAWDPPQIFKLIQSLGQVPEAEMYRAFNMGIGMVAITDRDSAPAIVSEIEAAGDHAAIIGDITAGAHDVSII